jgi:hypothetical protein
MAKKEMTVEELQKELEKQKKLVEMAKKAEEEARAERDALLQEVEKEAVAEEASIPVPERVLFRIPRDKEKGDMFVAVNGETFLIKRGVEVEIPRYVAEVIRNGMNQDERAELMIESLSNKAKNLGTM